MKILAFDSSNQALTVAVVEEKKLLSEQIINVRRNHSIQLMPAIDEALKQANLSLDAIDRIAVAKGPGSYTGLRIAVTIAKSLAWSQSIDLVGISSLKTLAANSLGGNNQLIVPLFDARRENIYTGLYKRDENKKLIAIESDTHISAEQWASFLASEYKDYQIELLGTDAEKFLAIFKEALGEKVDLALPEQNLPRASALAFLAQTEDLVESHHLTPAYLKLAEAEENWLEEHPDFEGGNLVEKV